MIGQYKSATQQKLHKESKARLINILREKINLCTFGNTYYFRTLIEKESA